MHFTDCVVVWFPSIRIQLCTPIPQVLKILSQSPKKVIPWICLRTPNKNKAMFPMDSIGKYFPIGKSNMDIKRWYSHPELHGTWDFQTLLQIFVGFSLRCWRLYFVDVSIISFNKAMFHASFQEAKKRDWIYPVCQLVCWRLGWFSGIFSIVRNPDRSFHEIVDLGM